MDYFGDIPKNEDGIRVSLDNMWDWSLTICAGKEHGILDVASLLINVLNKDSISSIAETTIYSSCSSFKITNDISFPYFVFIEFLC